MTSETWADIALPALLRHARATYGNAMRDALAERGYDDIPGNGLYVIGALAIGEAPLGQIIRELRVSKQAGGQLVDALVLRGYLVRETDPDDRRKLTVTLTERGLAAAETQGEARKRVDAELLTRIGAEKVAHGREMLATLIAMAREEREAA
jgi:DNA-binding MarR family transcriptional regulator